MNKNKLVTLSALALTAACGLVSCGGQVHPSTKVDVYFRAHGATIDMKDDEGATLNKVDLKDDECATMTVENEDNLKYGQDVTITIKPNPGFTFRKYDVDDWTADQKSPAVRPYVGLGNPHTLYNYPLQYGTAWTFEDLSKAKVDESGNPTGFYDEEYKITVKGDFFQRNIVIDYGNTDLKNYVLTYSSKHYRDLFLNALTETNEQKISNEKLSDYYELDEDYSSFLAGSDGITVTYKIKSSNEMYYFYVKDDDHPNAHWDPESYIAETEEDTKLKYENFSVVGNPETDKTELAIFDKSLGDDKNQLFVPSFINNKVTFFINWSELLKEGSPKGTTDWKFEDGMNVYLKKTNIEPTSPEAVIPDVHTNVYVNVQDTFATHLPMDYVQYTCNESTGEKDTKSDLSTSEFTTFTTETGEQTTYRNRSFERCDVERPVDDEPAIDTCYGVLFQLKEEAMKSLFRIMIDGLTISIDPTITEPQPEVEGAPKLTNWRREYFGIEETELPYWVSDDGNWYVVQLNPKGRRTGMDEEFFEESNLYYLYSNGSNPFKYKGNDGEIKWNENCNISIPGEKSL